MTSPFTFGKIAEGGFFMNRDAERKRFAANIHSRINTTLISPRRWGKSSLMNRVADDLMEKNRNLRFCFLDLFNIRNEQEFYAAFAKAVLSASATKWEERLEAGTNLLKRLVPKFQFGVDPQTDFSVSFDWKELKKHPEELLELPEKISRSKKIQVVVCIDEFQNIGFFDDPLAFQKKLRASWQRQQFATYCLYGSKRNMMMHLFENKSMPFYKFGDVMFLEKINEPHWISFITKAFRKTRKHITEEMATRIAREMEMHPYFVQQLSHEVWGLVKKKCTVKDIDHALGELLLHYTILFQKEVDGLSTTQVNFLKALCRGIEKFSAAETLHEFQLGTSANVVRIKAALESKEVIDIAGGRIEFMDPLFKRWFFMVYMGGGNELR